MVNYFILIKQIIILHCNHYKQQKVKNLKS